MFSPTVNALSTGRPPIKRPSPDSGSHPSQPVQVTRFLPLTYRLSDCAFKAGRRFPKLYEMVISCNLTKFLFSYIFGSTIAGDPEILRGYLPPGFLGDQ